MISLYRRGRVFWAQSNFSGVRRRWSLKTNDRVVAQELLRQAQLHELSSPDFRQVSWLEFSKMFREWIRPQIAEKTYSNYDHTLELLDDFLARHNVTELRRVDQLVIEAFAAERRKQKHPRNRRPIGEGGIKSYMRELHRVFAYAQELDYIPRNPVRMKNRNAESDRTLPFSNGEVKAMLSATYLDSRPMLRAAVLCLLRTGLRIGDVIHLQKKEIQGNVLTRRTTKRGRVVRVDLHPDLASALDAHFAAQNKKQKLSPYVFTTEFGKPVQSLDKHLRRLWKFCKISGAHAHRFRDTLAVRLLENGASLYDVAKILGNSHQVVERHYAPYVKELQERSSRLLKSVDFAA